MSGLLIGILLARTISGFLGLNWGWRSMYWLASFMSSHGTSNTVFEFSRSQQFVVWLMIPPAIALNLLIKSI